MRDNIYQALHWVSVGETSLQENRDITMRCTRLSVIISDEILQASQLTPSVFCQEIALHLFKRGI